MDDVLESLTSLIDNRVDTRSFHVAIRENQEPKIDGRMQQTRAQVAESRGLEGEGGGGDHRPGMR